MRYSTSRPQRGVSTAEYYNPPGNHDGWLGQNTKSFNPSVLYVSWWFYPSEAWYTVNSSVKLMRLGDVADFNSQQFMFSWTEWQIYVDNNVPTLAGCGGMNGTYWRGTPGQWNREELEIDTVNGTIKAWTNGQVEFNARYSPSCDNNTTPHFIYRIGADNNLDDTSANYYAYYDDFYVDTVRTRVEVCNSSTWAGRTASACEIQISSAWSANSVTVKTNQGALGSLIGKYLYVMDPAGNVNPNGFLLSAGAQVQIPQNVMVR